MRILHVIPSLSPRRGGASKAALDMVAALGRVGAEVHIACTNDHGDDTLDIALNQQLKFEGVNVRFFQRYSPRISAIREFAISLDFKRWLDQSIGEYDIVHVHALFSFTSTYTMFRARKSKVPYVAHPIGSLEEWSLSQGSFKKKLFLTLIEIKNLRSAAAVHFTADSEFEQAIKAVPGMRPIVIPLGLEMPKLTANASRNICRRYKIQEDQKIVLFLGRLHQKKGIEKTLKALSLVSNLPIKFLIAGSGEADYIEGLKDQVKQLKLADKCSFIGFVSGAEKAELLQGADLFVLNSYSENFGIAVIEASAYGTAVLISPGVALSKQVREHDIGRVCDVSPKEIAQQLVELVTQPNELERLGKRGREYVSKHHDWKTLARQLLVEYEKILAASPSQRQLPN